MNGLTFVVGKQGATSAKLRFPKPNAIKRGLSCLKGRGVLAAAALAVGLSNSGATFGAWVDGQSAEIVLGAPDFTTVVPWGSGTASASRFWFPMAVCTDTATGKVFVVALEEHRILRFSSTEALKGADSQAEAVFGQPDFTSTVQNGGGFPSAQTLKSPTGCAIDSAGRLFVADSGNSRVLRYDNAATAGSHAAADGVLGQADMNSFSLGTSADRFGGGDLNRIALGPNGALYVTDQTNRRVLRFDNAAGKNNGASADGVLGASDFTTVGAGGISATTFSNNIFAVAVDAAGNLFVSDAAHRRILRFNAAASKANGAPADGVLGADDLTSPVTHAVSASKFSQTIYGLSTSADGTLYVADGGNNRVLIFNNASGKANGAAADNVLGQPDFTSADWGATASALTYPLAVEFNEHAGYLLVADHMNHRVVGYRQAAAVDGACGSVAATSFLPTAGLCSAGNLSAAGVVRGNGAWTWSCDGTAGGTSTAPNACSASFGPTGANSGGAASVVSGGTWEFAPAGTGAAETSGFIPVSGHTKSPPDLPTGYAFPHGLVDFVLINGTPGSSATVTLTFPSALPPGSVWWKYGPTATTPTAHWYPYPGAVIAGNTVTLTITDDGDGDDAYTTPGQIADPGGPGVPLGAGLQSIPTVSEWGMLILSALMMGTLVLTGRGRLRRKAP